MEYSKMIQSISDLLLYVVPGYLGLTIFAGVLSYRIETTTKMMLSLAISYLAIATVRLFHNGNVYMEFIVASLLCCCIALLAAKTAQQKKLRDFMARKIHFSFAKGPWEDAYNYKDGSRIQFKCKGSNKFIIGVIHSFGDPEKYPWISISRYRIYDRIDGKEIGVGYKDNFLLININDIEYAELWPDRDSDDHRNKSASRTHKKKRRKHK